jgi:L-malate glycosyltransferase
VTSPSVLHVVLTLCPGGAERLVIDLARAQHREMAVAICCLDEPGVWASQLTSAGIQVEALHRKPGFHPSLGRRIADVARRHKANVIHSHQYSALVYGAIAQWYPPGFRHVATEHGRRADEKRTWKRRIANTVLTRMPHAIVAVSDRLRHDLIVDGYPAGRVSVIHNGVTPGPPVARGDRAAARQRLGVPLGVPVIGTVARLDPVKDLRTLLRAFAIVRQRVPDARLAIVGDGPERGALTREAAALDLGESVVWAGMRDDARELLVGFDIFVNSSLSEGVSVTVLEAMAAKLPVVATRVGGTPEVVVDPETGTLVPSQDPESMAQAIVKLAGDQVRCDVAGRAGQARVASAFGFDRMMSRYRDLYLSVV